MMEACERSALYHDRRTQGHATPKAMLPCECEEYENWQFNARIFLNSERPLDARFLTFFESLDREIDIEDVHECALAQSCARRTMSLPLIRC